MVSPICFAGGTGNSPVGVAGDSGGGLCAAHVALNVQNLNFQVTIN